MLRCWLILSIALASRPALCQQAVEGFTFLRWETFTCKNDVEGPKSFKVAVYRCDAFFDAIRAKLGKDDKALDCEFVRLPPDGKETTVALGSPPGERGRWDRSEKLVRQRIAPFLIARTEMSQRVYRALAGAHDRFDWPGPRQPANQLSWNDATALCRKHDLRLPGQWEWEFACRAGTRTPFCFGATITVAQVNYDGSKPYREQDRAGTNRKRTVAVGSLPHNAYGLFEMHGNLWEWCRDKDPRPKSRFRVLRGGAWNDRAAHCRSACIDTRIPPMRFYAAGLRPARTP